jgi:hypothetical protein
MQSPPDETPRSSSTTLPQQQCLYSLPLPHGQGALRESFLWGIGLVLLRGHIMAGWLAFEDQLHEQAVGDLLAVEVGVRGWGRRQAVVDGVGGGQARRLEPQDFITPVAPPRTTPSARPR